MKACLLAPVCFIISSLCCLFLLTAGDFLTAAGSLSVPVPITELITITRIADAVQFHLVFALICGFLFTQYYLFTIDTRLGICIAYIVVFSIVLFTVIIPCLFFSGLALSDFSQNSYQLQYVQKDTIYRTSSLQYVYIENDLITADSRSTPVLSIEQAFSPLIQSDTIPVLDNRSNGLMNNFVQFRRIEYLCVDFLSRASRQGWLLYLLHVAGIAIVLSSLWPSLKMSHWNALNSFSFSAAVFVMFFLLKWLENGALYTKIAQPPSFLPESVFLLILHVIIALLCNAAGIIGHLIHRSIKKERA